MDRREKGNWIKIGLLTAVLLMLIIGTSGCTTSNNPTATPTGQATVKATSAAASGVSAVESYLVSQGYNRVSVEYKGTDQDDRPYYYGNMTKDSRWYVFYLYEGSSSSDAKKLAEDYIGIFKNQNYTESYQNSSHWRGAGSGNDTGFVEEVFITDSNWTINMTGTPQNSRWA